MNKITALTLSLGVLFTASNSFAAGSAPSSSSPSGTTTSPTQLVCKTGEVIKTIYKKGKKPKKVCVKAMSGIISDDELYNQGRLLAKQGE